MFHNITPQLHGDWQYSKLLHKIIDEGRPVFNERTGITCYTLPYASFEYDCSSDIPPLVTTAKTNVLKAVAEIVGYLRGYGNAKQFRDIGTNTWDANANETKAWLNSPHRKGEDDMGMAYGVMARNWPVYESPMERFHNQQHDEHPGTIDLVRSVYDDLKAGKDNRGEIITFWNPGAFEHACLRPCLYQHIFTLIDGELSTHSTQRSTDTGLGLKFNMMQVYVLNKIMAQITGNKPGFATHPLINAHIYSNHLDKLKEQLEREPKSPGTFKLNPALDSWEALMAMNVEDMFTLEGYDPHPWVKLEMAV